MHFILDNTHTVFDECAELLAEAVDELSGRKIQLRMGVSDKVGLSRLVRV